MVPPTKKPNPNMGPPQGPPNMALQNRNPNQNKNFQRSQKWVDEIKKVNDIDALNAIAEKLSNEIVVITGKLRDQGGVRKNAAEKNCRVNPNNPQEIRGLYHVQKHRAVQEILFGPSVYCQIEKSQVESHFASLLTKTTKSKISEVDKSLWESDPKAEVDNDVLLRAFTPAEVIRKLRIKSGNKINSSKSVGLDQLSFYDLINFDQGGSVLAELFNACLRLQALPKCWNRTYSVLVPKKEASNSNHEDIKNWKCVTMYNTIPKLFYALLASRIYVWAIKNKVLSSTQRSYLLESAACENSFILQECRNEAKRHNSDLGIAWLNFLEASEHLPQNSVLYALERYQVPETVIKIVKIMFDQSETKFRVTGGYTDFIQISNGMGQGNPLNPVLLNLVLEPILRKLSAPDTAKLKIFSHQINHFVMPNELTLIASSAENLNCLLGEVDTLSKSLGLRFRVNKSAVLYSSGNNNEQNIKFMFCNQKLHVLSKEEIDKYFSVKQGLSIGQDGIPTLEEMLQGVDKIDKSQLANFQKIESVDTFLYPRLENCLRGSQSERPKLEEADKLLENKARNWLNISDQISSELVTLPSREGGAGFIPLTDLVNIMQVVQAFKMLTSECETVKNIAYESLKSEVSQLLTKKSRDNINMATLATYLSGRLKLKNISSDFTWQSVCQATMNLQSKINLYWRYQNEEMQLAIKTKNKPFVMRGNNRSGVTSSLKTSLIMYYKNELKKKNPEWKPRFYRANPKLRRPLPPQAQPSGYQKRPPYLRGGPRGSYRGRPYQRGRGNYRRPFGRGSMLPQKMPPSYPYQVPPQYMLPMGGHPINHI